MTGKLCTLFRTLELGAYSNKYIRYFYKRITSLILYGEKEAYTAILIIMFSI